MKRLNSALLFAAVIAISILTTGCPVGIPHPLCEENAAEKIDKKLLGTWKCLSDSAEIITVRIGKENDVTYNIEVLDTGENYMVDSKTFLSWSTTLDGHNFLFSKAAEASDDSYYLYHYAFEGKKLVIHDVGLLVGGIDAVTSTAAFREEVSASLKNPDCLSARLEYSKQ